MVTLDQAKAYLRIDSEDEDLLIQQLIETSVIYIDSCVGEGYKIEPKASKLAELLQLKIMADMYENRNTEVQATTKQDRIVSSILDKLSNYIIVV